LTLLISDVDQSLWAEAETLILDELSDDESADTAIEFYDVALRRPGTTREVKGLSQFARSHPGIVDQVTANVDRLRIDRKEKKAVIKNQDKEIDKLRAKLRLKSRRIDIMKRELAMAKMGLPEMMPMSPGLRKAREDHMRWKNRREMMGEYAVDEVDIEPPEVADSQASVSSSDAVAGSPPPTLDS